MDINKALRKQKKSYKRFMLSMCFIFLILPVVFWLSRAYHYFFFIYLLLLEGLILAAMLMRKHNESLRYVVKNDKMKVKWGLFGGSVTITCDKVVLVHVEKQEADMEIIFLTTSKFHSKKGKPVDLQFLKNHSYAGFYYQKLKKQKPEANYYSFHIKEGKYKKYVLLDQIYRNCVRAVFTEEAVERIKEYRH
jgi:hypothetical protein